MSASCSIELCTAIPLATKLWPPGDGGVEDLLDTVRLDGDDLVPQDVVDRVELQLGAVEHRGDSPQSLPRRGVPVERRAVVLDSDRLLELALRHLPVGHHRLHGRPTPRPGTVSTLVLALTSRMVASSRSAATPRDSVHADLLEEPPLAVRSGDVQRVAVAVALLAGGPDPRRDPEAQQQPREVIDEPAGRGRVVDAATATVLVDGHGAVGRPDVPEEQRDLALRARGRPRRGRTSRGCATRRDPPRRATAAMGLRTPWVEPERRPQPQRGATRRGVVVANRHDAERQGGLRHRREVLLVDARVAQRLPGHHRPVAQHVGEQDDLLVLPRVAERPGAGTCRGTASRSPVRRSPSARHPAYVRKGWFSVARTCFPEASVSRKTGRVPVEKTWVRCRRT